MARSNWSWRFWNEVLPRSNLRRQLKINPSYPTPGCVPHIEHCRKIGIHRPEKVWDRLFEKFCNSKNNKLKAFWWRLHKKEIWWSSCTKK